LVNPETAVVVIDVARAKSDPAHAVAKTAVARNSNRFAGGGSAQSLTLLDAAKIRGNEDAGIGAIPAGAFPRELRVSTDGQTLYLTSFGSNSLQVMDVGRLDPKRP
jgi:hypothetical protein